MMSINTSTRTYCLKDFEDKYCLILDKAIKKETFISVIILKLSNLNEISDKYGKEAASDVINKISDIVNSFTRSTDIATIIGEDEFVLALPTDMAQRKSMDSDVIYKSLEIVTDRIREKLKKSIDYELDIKIGTSFGIKELSEMLSDARDNYKS